MIDVSSYTGIASPIIVAVLRASIHIGFHCHHHAPSIRSVSTLFRQCDTSFASFFLRRRRSASSQSSDWMSLSLALEHRPFISPFPKHLPWQLVPLSYAHIRI
jgi:hypothetical protein